MEKLLELYTTLRGTRPRSIEALPKAGSNRHYVRLTDNDGESLIGVISDNIEENQCFVYLSRHFAGRGLPVPHVLAVSRDGVRYLQTDLGRTSLYNALEHGRQTGGDYNAEEKRLIEKTIRLLPHLQIEGAEGLDTERLLTPRIFDTRAAMMDLNYFRYCFLRTRDLPCDEERLEDDFMKMAADLASPRGLPLTKEGKIRPSFLFRDFQARNVMLTDGSPRFIDFQGGQSGPLQYDIASFLWQASARYPQTLREEMIAAYIDELHNLCDFDEEGLREGLRLFVFFRILQVLGAYGLRGYFERKPYFLHSIPLAIQNLRRSLIEGASASYPYLEEVLYQLVNLPQFSTKTSTAPCAENKDVPAKESGELTVRIFSFSYKKGIPEDCSGNGGGYVFDCRSTHNPGRYEPYRKLTGRDEPVIRFLEEDGEILAFLDHVFALADTHVKRYMERGFTDLMFAFGCTGGQHRSVYSAERLARHLHDKFGIEVKLTHREQGISETLSRTAQP